MWRLDYVGDDVYATVVKHNDEAGSQFVGYVLASPDEPRDRRDHWSVYAAVSPLHEKALAITLLDESECLPDDDDNHVVHVVRQAPTVRVDPCRLI